MRPDGAVRGLKTRRLYSVLLPWSLAVLFVLSIGLLHPIPAATDAIVADSGRTTRLAGPLAHVFSLVPSVAEIIASLDAAASPVRITHHDTRPAVLAPKTIVGVFLSPWREALRVNRVFFFPCGPLARVFSLVADGVETLGGGLICCNDGTGPLVDVERPAKPDLKEATIQTLKQTWEIHQTVTPLWKGDDVASSS